MADIFRLPYWLADQSTIAIVVTLLIFGVVVWFITKPDAPQNGNQNGIFSRAGEHLRPIDGNGGGNGGGGNGGGDGNWIGYSMVSLVDFGLVSASRLIFAFIMVWVIVYAVLLYTKWLGDDKHNLYAIIAFAMAALTIVTPAATTLLAAVIPWITILLIAGVLIIVALMTVGFTQKDITRTLESKEWSSTVVTWIIILVVIIFVSGLGTIFFSGDPITEEGVTGSSNPTGVEVNLEEGTTVDGSINDVGSDAFFATLFHPKVLGFIMVMLIGVFLVMFLGKGSVIR